jgi:hypothetical protein
LTNVDDTSDANKPVSSATQTALNLKANIADPTFTGTVSAASISTTGTITGNSYQSSGTGIDISFGPNITTGSIHIGVAQTSGDINLGTGTDRTAAGNIYIGTGGTAGGINIGRSNVVSIVNSATPTLTINRPIAPSYLPSGIGETNIGYQQLLTNNTYTTASTGSFEVMNTGAIVAGVWMVEGCFVFSGATGGGRRMGLNTASAVLLDTRTQGVATGSFAQLQVSSIFSFSTSTTVYLNINITAALGAAGTNISTLRWTRLA